MKTKLKQSDLKNFRKLFKITRKEISVVSGFGINVWGEYERSINAFNNMSKSNKVLIKMMLDPDDYNFFLRIMTEERIEKIGKYRYKHLMNVSNDICNQMKGKMCSYRQSLVNKIFYYFK